MSPKPVVVSIGMPAYNSENTIAESIDSLLAQDFEDFELIVSDNASTDRTWEIVQSYAARDSRVRPIRQTENIGANRNYTAVVDAARGEYFKWASSNDLCAPQFLSRCITYLRVHPDAVVAAPRTRLFDSDFAGAPPYEGDCSFDDPDPVRRFIDVNTRMRLNNVLNGVIRTDTLRSTRLIEHYRGADTVLVSHLALLGKIVLLEEPLFGRRMDARTATRLMSNEEVERHHYPRRTLRALFPSWRHGYALARVSATAPLAPGMRWRALAHVLRMLYWSRAQLRREILDAVMALPRHLIPSQ